MTNNAIPLSALVRLLAPTLDRRIAAGRPPQSGRLVAARARQLTSPSTRCELARDWEGVVEQSHRPATPRSPRTPLCRDRLATAELEVRDLLDALRSPCPTKPRGVAGASLLLRDGTGPLFNRRWEGDFRAVVRRATAALFGEE